MSEVLKSCAVSDGVGWEDHLPYHFQNCLQLSTSAFWRNGCKQNVLESVLCREAKNCWAMTGSSWCNCLQHTSARTQHIPEMWEPRPWQEEPVSSVLPAHQSRACTASSHFPFPFPSAHLLEALLQVPMVFFSFPLWYIEQNLSIQQSVALSPRTYVICVACWILEGCNEENRLGSLKFRNYMCSAAFAACMIITL